jgi:conjugal transfer/entry exclusion protein
MNIIKLLLMIKIKVTSTTLAFIKSGCTNYRKNLGTAEKKVRTINRVINN